MSKVTVAIPTYNRREYLKECLESVLAQTFQDFTIAVFDNGSDYDMRAFLDEFNDDRIVLLGSPVNIGSYKNCKRILEYIYTTPYAVIFHDDDVMHPELLAREVFAMDKHPELIWVGTSLKFIKDHKTMHDFSEIRSNKVFTYDMRGIVRLLLGGFALCYDSVMYRVEHFEGSVQLASQFGKWADRPYLVSLSEKGKVGILKEKLVNYRVHSGQDSQAATTPITEQWLLNTFFFYKECLDGLRLPSDRRLFYSYIVNTVVPTTLSFVRTPAELKQFLKPYQEQKLLKLRYLSARGIYRCLRSIVQNIKKRRNKFAQS